MTQLSYLQNRLTDIEKNLWLPKGLGRRGINEEFGINIYMVLYIKQADNKDKV